MKNLRHQLITIKCQIQYLLFFGGNLPPSLADGKFDIKMPKFTIGTSIWNSIGDALKSFTGKASCQNQ